MEPYPPNFIQDVSENQLWFHNPKRKKNNFVNMEANSSLAVALEASSTIAPIYPVPQGVPTSLTRCYNVAGTETDCLVQLFGDRTLFGITQLDGKLGTWVTCAIEESEMNSYTSFRVEVVLGIREDPLIEVYARRLAESIFKLKLRDPSPPILLGISIKDRDPKVFIILIDLLVQLYKDALIMKGGNR